MDYILLSPIIKENLTQEAYRKQQPEGPVPTKPMSGADGKKCQILCCSQGHHVCEHIKEHCGLPTPNGMGIRNSKGGVKLILFVTVVSILPYAWIGVGKHKLHN